MYQVGTFPNWDVWGEWNGKFRDDFRHTPTLRDPPCQQRGHLLLPVMFMLMVLPRAIFFQSFTSFQRCRVPLCHRGRCANVTLPGSRSS